MGIQQRKQLILVHGAVADGRIWEETAAVLSADFNIHSPTFNHFGPEGARATGAFGLNSHAAELAGLIEEIAGNGPVFLAGWSYGADIILNCLTRHPGAARAAFVYEPGYPGALAETDMPAYQKDVEQMFGPVFGLVQQGEIAQAVEIMIDLSSQKDGYFTAQPARYRQIQLENAHSLPKQLSQQEQPSLSATDLAEITLPLTVAHGTASRLFFQLASQAAAAAVANARNLETPGATHMLPQEDPATMVRLIKDSFSNA